MHAGFDSHIPIYLAFEHPDACNLVEPEDTIPIYEYLWGSSERYSDTCDYVLQCMYEENTIIALDRGFWFGGALASCARVPSPRSLAAGTLRNGLHTFACRPH